MMAADRSEPVCAVHQFTTATTQLCSRLAAGNLIEQLGLAPESMLNEPSRR